jgi:hypothetical protein
MSEVPKRYWFRFSLRTLLVLMTVLAIWLGLYAKRLRDRRDAILAIDQMDATIGVQTRGPTWLRPVFRDERYFWDVGAVAFPATRRLTDDDLHQLMNYLDRFNAVNQLKLSGSQITDAGLESLAQVSDTLIILDLKDTAVSDRGVMHLKRLKALRDLFIRGTNISEAGVSDLQQELPNCTIHH